MLMLPALLAGLLIALITCQTAMANPATLIERLDTQHHPLRLERLADSLNHPWSMAFLEDGDILIAERPGNLVKLDAQGTLTRIDGLPDVSQHGQGGLLDLALHPAYGAGNDWLYFTWSQPSSGGTSATTLSRARLDENALVEHDILFVQNRYSRPGRHYGSRLAWLADNTLLMTLGERGSPPRAQDRRDHAGSVLRLTETGKPPGDNPFINDPDRLDEIYTYGNRNPQGLVVTADGDLWSTEHGPRTGDELNRLVAGANYGWPVVSRGNDYVTNAPVGRDSAAGMRDPVHVFQGRFAPSGLTAVQGDTFPAWQGDLLAGGLLSERLMRLSLNDGQVVEQERILDGEIGRIRAVSQGPDGAIYLLEDAPQGALYRLTPATD